MSCSYSIRWISSPLNSTGPVGPVSLGTPPLGSRLMAKAGTWRTSASPAASLSNLS